MAGQFYDEDMAQRQERLAATPDMARQRRAVLDLLRLEPNQRVLDVGSGNGILAREMLAVVGERGHVCGVDSSDAMIAMAERLCPEGVFLKGEAASLPVDDLSFDAVTASQLLCFVPEVDRTLGEMYRVLRRGGRLVVLDSDWGSLVWNCRDQALMDRAVELLTGPYADAHVPRSLSRRLMAAGFEITDRQSFAILNWEPDPDSYSRQTAGFIEAMMDASDAFSAEDWERWRSDQAATAEAGEYMFSLNRYVFGAVKT